MLAALWILAALLAPFAIWRMVRDAFTHQTAFTEEQRACRTE